MPKAVNLDERRSEFADATWRVIQNEGLSAATLRRIAAEVRCTTGALTHYFPNREALLVEALRHAHFSAGARMIQAARQVRSPSKRLETILLEALPLDAERMREWSTRLAIWVAASDNKVLRTENSRRYQQWNELLETYLEPIVSRQQARHREAVLLMALVDGLALRLMLHAPSVDAMRAAVAEVIAEVRYYLDALQARYQT